MLPNVSQYDELVYLNTIIGMEEGDTVLSVKLRVQDPLDIPAHKIRVCEADKIHNICVDRDVIKGTKRYAIGLITEWSLKLALY